MFYLQKQEWYASSDGDEMSQVEPWDLGEFRTEDEARDALQEDLALSLSRADERPRFTCRDCLTRYVYEIYNMIEDERGFDVFLDADGNEEHNGDPIFTYDSAFDLSPWTREAYMEARKTGRRITSAYAWADDDDIDDNGSVRLMQALAPWGLFSAVRDDRDIYDNDGILLLPRDLQAGPAYETANEAQTDIDGANHAGLWSGVIDLPKNSVEWRLCDEALHYCSC